MPIEPNMATQRSKYFETIFGSTREFHLNQFPINGEVFKNIVYQKFERLAERLNSIWAKTDIRTISIYSIERNVTRVYNAYLNIENKNEKPIDIANDFRKGMEKSLLMRK